MMKCGGTTESKPADEKIQEICDKVREEVEKRTKNSFSSYVAVSYKTQVVAGTNYFVKIKVGDSEHIHVRIFQGLPHNGEKLELHSYEMDKTADDSLDYF